MNYLLDTNAWLNLFHRPERIRKSVLERLQLETIFGLSTISLVEVAQKNYKSPEQLGLSLSLESWLRASLPSNLIRLMPITPRVACRAYRFGVGFHGDPADRVIAATALTHSLTLITSDKRLIQHSEVPTLSTG